MQRLSCTDLCLFGSLEQLVSKAFCMAFHRSWNPRWALLIAIFLLGALSPGGGAVFSMDMGTGSAAIFWRAPSRQSLSIQRQLNFVGSVTADSSTQADARSPAEIFILKGLVSIDALAETLLTVYKDNNYGGIVLRRGGPGEILISHDKTLSGGTILVDRGAQGTAVLHALAHPGKEQLLTMIEPLLK